MHKVCRLAAQGGVSEEIEWQRGHDWCLLPDAFSNCVENLFACVCVCVCVSVCSMLLSMSDNGVRTIKLTR